jgi:hypothetical protein
VFAIAVEIGCDQPNFAKAVHRNFDRVARRGDRWGRGHEIWLRTQ